MSLSERLSGDIEVIHDDEEVEKFVGLRAYQSESVLGSIRTALEREESFALWPTVRLAREDVHLHGDPASYIGYAPESLDES